MIRRLATVLLAAVVTLVVATGVAGAWYTAHPADSGNGTATTADPSAPLSLTVTGTASAGLYPGGPGADVTVSVANPHPYAVLLTTVTPVSVAATPLSGRTCATHDVAVASPSSGLPATVAAGGSATLVLGNVVAMGNAAESGCQGAAFAVTFRLGGRVS